MPDAISNNGIYDHSGAIAFGEFSIRNSDYQINGGSDASLIAVDNFPNGPGSADVIQISSGFSSVLAPTSGSFTFYFVDDSGAAISGSDMPVYPLILDSLFTVHDYRAKRF